MRVRQEQAADDVQAAHSPQKPRRQASGTSAAGRQFRRRLKKTRRLAMSVYKTAGAPHSRVRIAPTSAASTWVAASLEVRNTQGGYSSRADESFCDQFEEITEKRRREERVRNRP